MGVEFKGENMETKLENLSNLERKVTVTVPADEVTSKVKSKLKEIAAKVKIPGFRPGKVPFNIIENNYAESAHADVLEKILQETYPEVLEKEKLNPAGMPNIKFVSSKPNEPFEYTATFEVYPEIKLAAFEEAEVEKQVAEIADSDVDEMLGKMRKSHATWREVAEDSYKAKAGDRLTIDFTTKPCDAANDVEPKTEAGVKFVLGDGTMWVDFEQPLHDVSVGEEKKYILQMPATHMDKTIAGKRSEFNVKVHKIHEPILPELNDEFAAKMNIAEGGIAKLKEEVRAHMERELELTLKDLFKQAVLNKVLELNPIEVPKTLVEDELRRAAEDWQRRIKAARGTLENAPAFPRSEFEPQAKRNVALGLLMSTLVKEHNIAVAHQEVRKKIEELIGAYYEDNEEVLNKVLSDQKRLTEIELLLLEEKLIEHLSKQIKPVEKKISYKDIVAKNK